MRVKEDIVVLEDEHPYYESLNKKLLKEAEEVDYSLSYNCLLYTSDADDDS